MTGMLSCGSKRAASVREVAQQVLRKLFGFSGKDNQECGSLDTSCIFSMLDEKLRVCNPKKNDYSALKPSPEINSTLTSLVEILCQDFGHENDSSQDEGSTCQNFHACVVQCILEEIHHNNAMSFKAKRIKQVAALAEAELEFTFCKQITRTLDALSTQVFDEKVADLLSSTSDVTPFSANHEIQHALARARVAFKQFPYTDNYELVVASELSIIQKLVSAGGSKSFAKERISKKKNAREPCTNVTPDITFAFCGSGPLPLTGIFLHVFTGAPVVLVDCDARAVECSRHLMESLARHNVVTVSKLHAIHQDAINISFEAPRCCQDKQQPESLLATGKSAASCAQVTCDVLLLASLLPTPAKVKISRKVGFSSGGTKLMLVRSATALAARFAYESVPTQKICDSNWVFEALLVPKRDVHSAAGDPAGSLSGVRSKQSLPNVMLEMDSKILNTVEVFQKKD